MPLEGESAKRKRPDSCLLPSGRLSFALGAMMQLELAESRR